MSNTLKDKAFPIMKNLKQIRNEKRLSQQELANLSGISLRTIQRMEKGESKGSPYVIRSLCQALDVDPQVIYIESDIVHEKGPDQLLGTTDIESISSIETDRDNAANIKYINFSSLIVLLIPFANLLSVPIFYFLFKKRLIDKQENHSFKNPQFPNHMVNSDNAVHDIDTAFHLLASGYSYIHPRYSTICVGILANAFCSCGYDINDRGQPKQNRSSNPIYTQCTLIL